MKNIIKVFLSMLICFIFCFPSCADTVWTRFYDINISGKENVYYVQFPLGSEFGYYYAENAQNPVPYMYCTSPFEYYTGEPTATSEIYSSDKIYSSDGRVMYVGGSNYLTMIGSYGNAIGIPADNSKGVVEYLYTNGFVDNSGDQQYSYDSSIPAPKNLTFATREEGGNFIIAGTKYFGLNWTSPFDNTLMCRIDANVSGKAGTGGVSKVQYVRLADETTDFKVFADSGKYEFTANFIEEKIGGNLQRMDYIRLQYYRVVDGKIKVGPISTVKLHLGLFGKYTYTVTTEYPNDESDVGDAGGMDDTYYDKWTSDGENYYEYDQDGNIVDSGTSSGSIVDSFNKLINSLLNIPTIITRLFSSLTEMMSGIGALPAYFAQVVTWLPSEITALISLGIVVVIALRIFGR